MAISTKGSSTKESAAEAVSTISSGKAGTRAIGSTGSTMVTGLKDGRKGVDTEDSIALDFGMALGFTDFTTAIVTPGSGSAGRAMAEACRAALMEAAMWGSSNVG